MNGDAGVRDPIRIGISSCLLRQAVRFDGGHKRDSFLTETFGEKLDGKPVDWLEHVTPEQYEGRSGGN